jgi:hypothetical protein
MPSQGTAPAVAIARGQVGEHGRERGDREDDEQGVAIDLHAAASCTLSRAR